MMYAYDILQQRNDAKEAERLKNKVARYQAKNMRPSCWINEEIRTAGEFDLPPVLPPPASSPFCMTTSSSDWLVGEDGNFIGDMFQTAVGGETQPQEPDASLYASFNTPREMLTSPSIECELCTTSSEEGRHVPYGSMESAVAVEEVVVIIDAAAGEREVPLVASEGNIDDDNRQQQSASSSLVVLSENLEGLIPSQGGDGIVDAAADSSIVLETEEECDNSIVLPDDESLSITFSSTNIEMPLPPLSPPQQQDNTSHGVMDSIDAFGVCLEGTALQLPQIVGIPRVENEPFFSIGEFGQSEVEQRSTPLPSSSPSPSPLPPYGAEPFQGGCPVAAVDSVVAASRQSSLAAEKTQCPPPPRCFDYYLRRGKAKRKQREAEAEECQRRLNEEEERRHTPQVSLYAERRGPRSFNEYVEASREWETLRANHMKSIAAQLEVADEKRRSAVVRVNATSERLLKEMVRRKKRVGVVESATQHAAARQSWLKQLQEKYAPSFKPTILHTTGRRKVSESEAQGKRGSHATEESFYDRFMRYRGESEKKREQLRQREAEKQHQQPKTKRTITQITEYVRSMLEREERRRDKLRRQVEKEQEEEEEKMRAMKPQVSRRSSELAERFRQRQRTTERSAPTSTSVPHVGVSHKGGTRQKLWGAAGGKKGSPEPKPPTPPTNRKLSFSSKSGSCHCKPVRRGLRGVVPSAVSPEFEERNARLLRMRQQRAESRRHEVEKELAQACTFRPKVDPVSRRMADSHRRDSVRPNTFQQERSSCLKEKRRPCVFSATMADTTKDVEEDLAWASDVREAMQVDEAVEGNLFIPHDDDTDEENLKSHIEGLEAILKQWKQLEAKYRI
ncbi:hypothetical protein MOQ_000695 [Trypanosoma cruzi marinkellei]|uniref:Uncharacterized protein n=1 Tax=Trypanosoma cruzi marinkellei TaxID=85056 RepID=K2MV52_TRYCR|nr:hypothetical protein MOQ_000695 [Trypanosoma cruzi marinkellei]